MHAVVKKSNTFDTTNKHFTHETQFYDYIHTQPTTLKKKIFPKPLSMQQHILGIHSNSP